MTEETKNIKKEADYYKILLQSGAIDIERAKEKIMPYINLVNKTAKEKAKLYNVKPRYLSFRSYSR